MAKKEKFNIYQMVTDRIIEGLVKAKTNSGKIPWHKPWINGVPHQNFVSRKPYRGVNVLTTSLSGIGCPYWITFKQLTERGGELMKGAKAMPIVFWAVANKKKKQDETEAEKYYFLKYYKVFNISQVNGIEIPPRKDVPEFEAIQEADDIIKNYPGKLPVFVNGGNRAYYDRLNDKIGLPSLEQFKTSEGHAATKFHEIIHSTGHASRLNRKSLNSSTGRFFANEDYSVEELTAEIGGSILCAMVGIEDKIIDNATAYIAGWLEQLENDNRFVITAAQAAQKAVDYIIGRQYSIKKAH